MTTTEWICPAQHTDDATFRVWGKAISDALTAIGFIKTADTGQINWASVTRPGVGTSAGYEIRILNDSLHATCPIYVKIEFGTESTTATRPAIWFTVATGSNGSGTLNGTTIFARTSVANATTSGIDQQFAGAACMVSGAAWLSYGGAVTGSGCRFHFGIHRTCDSDGTPNGNGAYVWVTNSSHTVQGRQYLRSGGLVVTGTAVKGLGDTTRTSCSKGADAYVLPAWIYTNKPEPVVGLVGIFAADFHWGNAFPQRLYGVDKEFWPLTQAGGPVSTGRPTTADGLNSNVTHGCIWE
jgi:hypothetical protein